MRFVDKGHLKQRDDVFHESDGFGVFHDGAGEGRAVGEIEQGEAVVNERHGPFLNAAVGVARV